nr:unnamed protein product [Callosobruchus analis]
MANQPSFIKDFIDIYRKHNCLWQVKSPEYANKQLRSVAYDELLQLFKTVSDDATIEAVKNKINNMRSAFRKELKKVKESKRSGTSSEQVYIPTLWYYDSLLFTIQHEQCRETISSCRDFQEEEENETQVENEVSIFINFFEYLIVFIYKIFIDKDIFFLQKVVLPGNFSCGHKIILIFFPICFCILGSIFSSSKLQTI